jgi:acyl carrier protein
MSTLQDQIIQLLRDNAKAGILPAHIAEMPLLPETTLADLGIDSLGKIGLLSALMELTDKYLADDAIKDSLTLAEVAELVS